MVRLVTPSCPLWRHYNGFRGLVAVKWNGSLSVNEQEVYHMKQWKTCMTCFFQNAILYIAWQSQVQDIDVTMHSWRTLQTSLSWIVMQCFLWVLWRRMVLLHDDIIKWKQFPRYWPFVRGIHRVNSPHKGQWRGALMFSLICARKYGWVNNREAGDLWHHGAHYDVTVKIKCLTVYATILLS